MKWKFKKDAEKLMGGDNFWTDLTCEHAYIQPEKILDDPEQVKKIENAVLTLKSFENQLKDSGLYEHILTWRLR